MPVEPPGYACRCGGLPPSGRAGETTVRSYGSGSPPWTFGVRLEAVTLPPLETVTHTVPRPASKMMRQPCSKHVSRIVRSAGSWPWQHVSGGRLSRSGGLNHGRGEPRLHAHPHQPGRLVLPGLGRSGVSQPQPRGCDPLSYLAQYFDAIEINSSFNRIPDPQTTGRWGERVADHPDFRFTAKIWRGFTHEGTARPQDEAAFRDTMAPLHDAGRLGACCCNSPMAFTTPPTTGSTCGN